MRRIVATALACLLTGCATTQISETATAILQSSDTTAVCKAADVGTTAYALHSRHFVETNKVLVALGGAHSVLPAAILGVGLWWLVKTYVAPADRWGVNTVTCGTAALNIWRLAQ